MLSHAARRRAHWLVFALCWLAFGAGLVYLGCRRPTPLPADSRAAALVAAGYQVREVPAEIGGSGWPAAGLYYARPGVELDRVVTWPHSRGKTVTWAGAGYLGARQPDDRSIGEEDLIVGPDYELFGDPAEFPRVRRALGLR